MTDIYTNAKGGNILKSLPGKLKVYDLYNKTLDITKQDESVAALDAIKYTANYFKDMNCNINTDDINNILYGANNDYSRVFQQVLDANTSFSNQEDVIKSCKKLAQCFANASGELVSLQNCKDSVNSIFSKSFDSNYYQQVFNEVNYGAEMFFNGKKNDSTYDIIRDIRLIGKYLFFTFKDPTDLFFYELPKVASISQIGGGTNNGGSNSNSEFDMSDGDIPWISSSNDNANPTISSTGIFIPGLSGSSTNIPLNELQQCLIKKLNAVSGSAVNIGGINTQLSEFVNATNIIIGNPALVLGNQCINALQTGTQTEGGGTVTIPQLSLEDYNDCINQTIGGGTSVTSGAEDLFGSGATIQDIQDKVGSMIDMLTQSGNVDGEELTQKCVSQCQELPIVSRMVCFAQCACGEYGWGSSLKVFDNKDIFRIKFCMIPAAPNPSPGDLNAMIKTEKVSSIEEIMAKIKELLSGLKNSPGFFKSVQTKEMTDTSTAKINFGNRFSFNASATTLPAPNKETDSEKEQKQKERNEMFMTSILNLNQNYNLPNERNKYIFLHDYVTSKSSSSENTSLDKELENQKAISISLDISREIQNQKNVVINQLMEEFLSQNFNFWIDMAQQFEEMNNAISYMSTKVAAGE